MEFKELENKVMQNAVKYGERNKIKIDQDFALLKLSEEVGEFAQAVLIHQKKCRPEKYLTVQESKKEVAKELADVMGIVMVNAQLLDIDLEEAINIKWINKEK